LEAYSKASTWWAWRSALHDVLDLLGNQSFRTRARLAITDLSRLSSIKDIVQGRPPRPTQVDAFEYASKRGQAGGGLKALRSLLSSRAVAV